MSDIAGLWRQSTVPVIYRPPKGPVLVKLPYREDNYSWLRDDRRNRPVWLAQSKCWEIPHSWFDDTVNRTLARFRKLWLIQPYREKEICAPACWNAKGYECNCSCLGVNHGGGEPGGTGRWYTVSEARAERWRETELSCRLLTVSP